jgi:uncharacterized protein
MIRRNLSILCALFGLAFASGCSFLSPRPDPTRFYILSATATAPAAATAAAAAQPLRLGLGPVTLPDYLLNPEVVTRVSLNRIELDPASRWAEPFDQNFRAILARDLQTLLGNASVTPYPWYSSTHLDFAIEVNVERFERDPSGATRLVADWRIRDGRSNRALLAHHSSFSAPAAGSSVDNAVAALSRELNDLSRQIADAVTALNSRPAASAALPAPSAGPPPHL